MFSSFIPFLIAFWLVRSVKQVLFWIYLWQLKQYHRGRFLAHFKTENGKKLMLQPMQVLKTALLVVFLASSIFYPFAYLVFLPLIVFLAYFLESMLYFKSIFSKRLKSPKLTKKTGFLLGASFVAQVVFAILIIGFIPDLSWIAFALLAFDVLLPVIISGVVILFQPLADRFRLNLQKRAKEKIESLNNKLTIIGITGSYAKTSTKEYLATILSEKFKVLTTKEHQNTEVGIPQAILDELGPEHDIFIAEMGAYDKGTIKRISDFLKPEIGIVTGVNSQHLALFGSMDNLLSAEGGRELLQSLPTDGLLVVNGENDFCQDLYSKADVRKFSYKLDDKVIKNLDVKKNFASFSIDNTQFKVDVLGRHNVLNLLGAILVARELGMSIGEIAKASEKITAKNSSFKILRNNMGMNVIDSTYSANPDGVIADLDYLKIYPGKKVIVMPSLIELGKTAKEVHYSIGAKIAQICQLAIITNSDHYEDIKNGAIAKGMKEESILLIGDANLIFGKVKTFCKEDDTILLEGRINESIISRIKKGV